jgi:hypothetical protein
VICLLSRAVYIYIFLCTLQAASQALVRLRRGLLSCGALFFLLLLARIAGVAALLRLALALVGLLALLLDLLDLGAVESKRLTVEHLVVDAHQKTTEHLLDHLSSVAQLALAPNSPSTKRIEFLWC